MTNELDKEGANALKALEGDEKDEQPSQRKDKTPEEVMANLSKAQIAQILDRGVVGDRLSRVKLPADRVGYWVRERPEDIDRYIALGGRIEQSGEVGMEGLHGAGDDRIRVGDVILMSLPRRIVEAIHDIDKQNRRALTADRAKGEFLKQKVPGVPHYEEA